MGVCIQNKHDVHIKCAEITETHTLYILIEHTLSLKMI